LLHGELHGSHGRTHHQAQGQQVEQHLHGHQPGGLADRDDADLF
jgi:hypothetical protein